MSGRLRVGRLVVLTLVLTLAATGAWSQSIQATVDRNEVAIQEQILLNVRVEGQTTMSPELPDLSQNFRVLSRGRSQETQIVNGQVSFAVSHNYLLIPLAVGEFEIGPVRITIDGSEYSSRPFTVRIHESQQQSSTNDRDLFLSVSISTQTPYVGQEVIYRWRFFRRVQVADAQITKLEFGDMVVEELGEVQQYQTTVDGVQYIVNELQRSLFPQRAGKLTIAPSELRCEVAVRQTRRGRRSLFDDFFGGTTTEPRVVQSRALELDVRELPEAPPGYSGLIGDYSLAVDLSKTDLEVGQSATLEVQLSGSGNVQMMSSPDLPELPQFKVYPDKPASSIDRSGRRLRGSRTFRQALVPLEAGEFTVPSIQLVYFDPREERYITEASGDIDVRVVPGEGEEELMLTESVAPTTGKVAVRILADDILPIHRELSGARRPLLGTGAWNALALAPPLLFLGLLFARRRQLRFAQDSGLRRRQAALKRVVERLRKLESRGTEEGAPAASLALREYVGDRLTLEGAALTPLEVRDVLIRRGLDEELAQEACGTLERLESAQYGGGFTLPPAEELSGQLRKLARRLDKAIGAAKGGGR